MGLVLPYHTLLEPCAGPGCRELPYHGCTGSIVTVRWKNDGPHLEEEAPFISCFFSLPSFFFPFLSFFSLHPFHTTPHVLTMATSLRFGTSALRSSLATKPVAQSAAFNGLRAYSTGKTKVRPGWFMLLIYD